MKARFRKRQEARARRYWDREARRARNRHDWAWTALPMPYLITGVCVSISLESMPEFTADELAKWEDDDADEDVQLESR